MLPTRNQILTCFRAPSPKFAVTGWSALRCWDRGRAAMRTPNSTMMLLFLRDLTDRAAEMNRLPDLRTKLIEEGGPLVHAMPYRAGSYMSVRRLCWRSARTASIYDA